MIESGDPQPLPMFPRAGSAVVPGAGAVVAAGAGSAVHWPEKSGSAWNATPADIHTAMAIGARNIIRVAPVRSWRHELPTVRAASGLRPRSPYPRRPVGFRG